MIKGSFLNEYTMNCNIHRKHLLQLTLYYNTPPMIL